MKISNSKKEVARIISENGGWREGAEWAAQCKSDVTVSFYSGCAPCRDEDFWRGDHLDGTEIKILNLMPNWHQTILSRSEYFHLCPELGELCGKVTEENRHEQVWTNPPTIEQLAADYRNTKDYADFKQQEADDAKADADARLKTLELAGEDIGLLLSPITANKEPELVITDWRDLQAGDVISVSGKWWEPDSEYAVDENDGSRDAPIRVGGYWVFIGECSFKFIRRP